MHIWQRGLRLARLALTDPAAYRTIRAVRAQHLTYLSRQALIDLHEAVHQLERLGRSGLIIEAGVALGGSTIVLAQAKTPACPLYAYDVFAMIPPPSADDGPDAHARYAEIAGGHAAGIQGNKYYGYEDALLGKVLQNFAQFGIDPEEAHVRFWPGLFENTIRVDQPVALAHIDCDWYDSVMLCLERITPYLIPGGILVIDDYEDWSGCKRAVDDYFAGRRAEFKFVQRTKLHIERRY